VAISMLEQVLGANDIKNAVVDVDSEKASLISYLENKGFVVQRELIRMFIGQQLTEDKEAQYLILGPEFG